MRTALVLSGGGAPGMAHIGVIRVLDSLGIRPDLIVGSSLGSVVGAMYASGMSGRQLDSVARALPLSRLFGERSPLPSTLGAWSPLVVVRGSGGRAQPDMPFVQERALNLLLSAWFLSANLAAADDFDALPIPFRAIATDLVTREPLAIGSGDLARAVRASISLPLIMTPVRDGTRWLGDGSLTANVPIAIARALGADRVIVSDVSTHLPDTLDYSRMANMGKLMLSMLLSQPREALTVDDQVVRPDVGGQPKLDFSAAAIEKFISRGYAAGAETLVSSDCSESNEPGYDRAPAHVVSRVHVAAPTTHDAEVLSTRFGRREGQAVPVDQIQSVLRNMAEGPAEYDAVWLNPRRTGDTISVSMSHRKSSAWVAAVGGAFDSELGFRGWAGAAHRVPVGVGGSAALRAAVGRWRQELTVVLDAPTSAHGNARAIASLGRAHEALRRFGARGNALPPLIAQVADASLGVELSVRGSWSTALSATHHTWSLGDDATRTAFGGALTFRRTPERNGEPRVHIDGAWNETFSRAAVAVEWPVEFGRLRIAPMARLGTGRVVPEHAQFAIGGDDGFPGLHAGEGRAADERFIQLRGSYRILGTLWLSGTAANARVTPGDGDLLNRRWLRGFRIDGELNTPVGPFRLEYGRATGGRSSIRVRIGQWF